MWSKKDIKKLRRLVEQGKNRYELMAIFHKPYGNIDYQCRRNEIYPVYAPWGSSKGYVVKEKKQ